MFKELHPSCVIAAVLMAITSTEEDQSVSNRPEEAEGRCRQGP